MQLRYVKLQKNIQKPIPQFLSRGNTTAGNRLWELHVVEKEHRDCREHVKITRLFLAVPQVIRVNNRQWPFATLDTKHSWALGVVSMEFFSALFLACSSADCCIWHCSVLRLWLPCWEKPSQTDLQAGQVPPASFHPGNVCSSRESTFLYVLWLLIDSPGRKCNL